MLRKMSMFRRGFAAFAFDGSEYSILGEGALS